MAIPTVFAPVKPQDFTLTPLTVHKQFVINSSSYSDTSSGYRLWEAIYPTEHLKLEAPNAPTYPTNSIDGTYKHIIWKSIDTRYYRFPYDRIATLEHANQRYTYKHLGVSASILSIPYHDVGERIKPGSVQITGSNGSYYLQDDGNGNLYDASINTGSFPSNSNLVARWDFDELYRKFKTGYANIETGRIPYSSKVFTPDTDSEMNRCAIITGKGNMITGSRGLGEGYWLDTNLNNSEFDSYVLTDNRPEFNFDSSDDFTIAFWFYRNDNSEGSFITKNGVIKKVVSGKGVYNKDSAEVQGYQQYSQSYFDELTDVYPYDISISPNSKIWFRRSDGINTLSISSSTDSFGDTPCHVSITKSGSLCSLYVDGILERTGSDPTLNPVNNHCLMLGARNRNELDYGRHYLRDIRFYNKAFPQNQIQTLATSQSLQMFQTAVVGNVFYRTGDIVISNNFSQYNQIFTNPDSIKWKSTHTIYQYECLVRIKKGHFNLTHNPTALKSYKSDLLIDDFTGSLYPYATSVGLYNQAGELVAVAKLGQAIQMRDDVDLNFLIRFDA